MKGKLIIFSAPSGSGKSTIINYLMQQNLNLAFSISATSRLPRGNEQHGVEYFFLTPDEFREKIQRDEFLEHEEVYKNCFYGTLKSHIEDLLEAGKNVIFDVDVIGGLNIKKYYGDSALGIFIQPPSIEELRKRLIGRATDCPEVIEKRIQKAEFELSYANQFDRVVVNDDLAKAKAQVLNIVENFLAVKDNTQRSTLNAQLIRTGIFGGSFNPIHAGHLALANYLCEYEGLDELWFLISPQNPLKKREELWPDDFRLRLVEAAIKEYPKFKASDFEFALPRPSYTINTLDKLKEAYPNRSFKLIVGSDNWINFRRWKDYQRIITENKIIIYPRPQFVVDENDLPENARRVNAPLFDISSTFIRESLKEGKDIRYFLHPEVYRLIKEEK